MAESPLAQLARVAGGVVLTHGRLGHQVLGQMLILGTNEVAVAAATVVIAATSRQRDAVAQAAIRTVVPAVLVHYLVQRHQQRLARQEAILAEKARAVQARAAEADRRVAAAEARLAAMAARDAELQKELQRRAGRFRRLRKAAVRLGHARLPPPGRAGRTRRPRM